jgi:RNA polymerase sigma factor (sigma-70 family)
MARTPRQIEDERLALRCRLGEPAAFAELVETMERPLLYFARSIVHDDEAALDVLQAVWMTAFRGLRRLDDPAALRSWLYRVTRGQAVDHVRRDTARASAERGLADKSTEIASSEKEVETMIANQEKSLQREKRYTTAIWIYVVLLTTYFMTGSGLLTFHKIEGTWIAVSAVFWFLFGAVFFFIHQINKTRFEVIKEIKGVELRLAALEERLTGRGASN